MFIFIINRPSQKALDVKWSQLWSVLPVSIAFCHEMNAKRFCFLWQKKKGDEESKSQEPCRWTQGKTHTPRKMPIFKSFLKIICRRTDWGKRSLQYTVFTSNYIFGISRSPASKWCIICLCSKSLKFFRTSENGLNSACFAKIAHKIAKPKYFPNIFYDSDSPINSLSDDI